ncbi:hypothetical protein N658DRAFT_459203, partial [Parathielavia hyrcaniae]
MAYFTGAPGPSPRDVAVVKTNPGETALWANSNTTGFFTTSGVTFWANLGPRVDEGEFAGTGDNGFGRFSCYQRYVKDLYTYGDTVCSQVYLCDHSVPPPGRFLASLHLGTIIGIAIGVVGGVLFLVATGLVIWYFRRSRRRRAQAERAATASDPMSATLSPGSEFAELKAQSAAVEAAAMHEIYEMDGQPLRSEMANDTGKVELDPDGHGNAELDPTAKGEGEEPSRSAAARGTNSTDQEVVSPLSPPALGSQSPPGSPPPEYASIGATCDVEIQTPTRFGRFLASHHAAKSSKQLELPHTHVLRTYLMQPTMASRRGILPLLLLVGLVNLAWSLYQLPVSRVVESRLCREHYAAHHSSALRPDGSVPEELCKIDDVQRRLGRLQGVTEALWVAGDLAMTIPLVSLADQYGHRVVLRLNLIPRIFLLAWTFAVGYFDVLPVNAIVAASVLSFLGGDCVFNSIVYSLVSDLTDDHVLRATFFGYVNAVSSIFSLQLGPALAAASMTSLLWRPFWIGIVLLLLAIPLISTLAGPPARRRLPAPAAGEEDALIPRRPSLSLKTTTTRRFRTTLALLANPTRNFLLLLSVFFLASLASSDTKLLPLRNARENAANAHICLVFSVLGALAIALSPAIWALVPALLVYALGIALPMFTYSLLKAPGMGLEHQQQREDASGMQLFSAVMFVRTVGTLAGAVVMPSLWVGALDAGGWALGLPYARTGYDLCEANCTLNGVPFPDKHTLQLPLDGYQSEQCPPIYIGNPAKPTAISKVCLDIIGTNIYFNFSSFPGYTYSPHIAVAWKLKGNPLDQATWTSPPPDQSVSCGPNPSGDGLTCKLPFSEVLGVPAFTSSKDQLMGMCPNGDREGLILYLRFFGQAGTAFGYQPGWSVPLNTQDGRGCKRWGWYSPVTRGELRAGLWGRLYMGAGNNDVSKATWVGNWTASEAGQGAVAVTYDMTPPYVLRDVHIDLECLPIDKCAPGTYTYTRDGLEAESKHTATGLHYPPCNEAKAALIMHAAVDRRTTGTVCYP